MNIAIIDDDKGFCNKLKNKLSLYLELHADKISFQIFSDDLHNTLFNEYYDLAFIDIDLDTCNGIELAKKMKLEHLCNYIVFVSSYSQLVFDSLIVQPFFFIRKEHLDCDFSVFKNLLPDTFKSSNLVTLKWKGKKRILSTEKIVYIESYGRNLIIYTKDDKYYDYHLLCDFLKIIQNDYFIRIHRSFVVNYCYVSNYTNTHVELFNGIKLNMSRKYKDSFEKGFKNYIKNADF